LILNDPLCCRGFLAKGSMQSDRLKRREFIVLLGGAAAAWPLSASAQQPKRPLIGFLSNPSRKTLTEVLLLPAFHRGLAEARYAKARMSQSNIVSQTVKLIEFRRSLPT
jgi:hypothetical protein